ncbi:MAG: DUF389 domain-containing protein [Crocinitomicaceae bacterium]
MSEPTNDQELNEEKPQENTSKKANSKGERKDDPTKIHIETNPVEIISGTAGFIKSILSLRTIKYDHAKIIESVKDGIVFKGYNVWILMFSILIASIGLNVNSTAVVIGAMLISPLMGPIKGIGFGVATNDFRLLLDSLKNLGVTVGISLLVAYIYFLITPIHDPTENILARTEPTFLDVLIALFGGLAGVVAHTQGKNDTVIPGVAIATALMPPLCTAGYGLAVGNWAYFAGASYLFILNSLLIAGSAYFFVRYLKFPKKEYLTPKIEKRVRVYTLAFIIVAVAPSGYLFYKMTKRSIFLSNANLFVEQVIQPTDENMVITPQFKFDWENSEIDLSITNYFADNNVYSMWNRQLNNFDLENVTLTIHQDDDIRTLMDEAFHEYDQTNHGANTLAELLSRTENDLLKANQRIKEIEDNIKSKEPKIQFDHLLAGFKIDYPEYKRIYINESYVLNQKKNIDTVYAISVEFNAGFDELQQLKINHKISQRMKLELNQKAGVKQDSVRVIVLN